MMASSWDFSSGSREILPRGATACAPNILCGLRLRMVGRPALGREGTLISTRAIKAARRMALPREEHVQGPLQVRGETVPREHLEKTSGFVARLLQQLAARACLRGFAVARGAARQRMHNPSEAMTVLSRQDDFFLAR